MGLIKAGLSSVNTTFADQWKEYFYCESLCSDILMSKGQKRIGKKSSNTKGNDNIISNGSIIAVADGQCMLIVEQGKVVEVCAEPGEFVWDSSTEPSIFSGNLGLQIKETFKAIGKRFTFGGDVPKDQRIYFINTKEIMDNKFGTQNPFMFTVVNKNAHMDRTVSIRCNGVYSYKITNPILFYTQVAGNVTSIYERSSIDDQLKTEFISALQPAFSQLSELELRPAQIPAHQAELENAVNNVLKFKWSERIGITVVSIAMNPITLTDEDLKKIQQMEDAASYGSSLQMMAGRMGEATASALEAAANNPNGAINGFMGMGMAMNANGMNNIQGLYSMNKSTADSWTCQCGQVNTGKFCTQCGQPKVQGWTCSCGAVNQGKFCSNCGQPKPQDAPLYRCDKCGWTPEDPHHPPKFCPECGDVFDDNDK